MKFKNTIMAGSLAALIGLNGCSSEPEIVNNTPLPTAVPTEDTRENYKLPNNNALKVRSLWKDGAYTKFMIYDDDSMVESGLEGVVTYVGFTKIRDRKQNNMNVVSQNSHGGGGLIAGGDSGNTAYLNEQPKGIVLRINPSNKNEERVLYIKGTEDLPAESLLDAIKVGSKVKVPTLEFEGRGSRHDYHSEYHELTYRVLGLVDSYSSRDIELIKR